MKAFSVLLLAVQFMTSKSVRPSSLLNPPWQHCVQQLHSLNRWQEFTSPGFPDGITRQTQCSWIISVNPPKRIKLAFQTLNLTGSVNNCFTQYIEIWEIKTGTSQGRMCGDRRPGDYVSYGHQIRFDLKADTAAAGHQGFLIKYKATSEPGGFKSRFSFTPPRPRPANRPARRRPGAASGTTPRPAPNNGGRVNIGLRQRQRELAARRPPPGSGNRTRTQQAPSRFWPIPIRSTTRRTPSPRPPSNDKLTVRIRDDDGPKLNLPIIIGVPVGGFIFLSIIALIMILCFCKRKKNKMKKQENNTDTDPQKNPVNAIPNPIQRRHDLPGVATTPVPRQTLPPQHPQNAINVTSQRSARDLAMTSLERRAQPPVCDVVPNAAITDDIITVGLQQGTIVPVDGGYLFHCPTEGTNTIPYSVSTHPRHQMMTPYDDEGYGTCEINRTQSHAPKQKKKVPTLKRKFSEWEKQEIKKGTLKI